MKSLKNKVIMSAIVLAFALVATIGSTYAWFTVSSTVTAAGLNLNVQSADSLLFRVYDGELPATVPADEADILDPDTYSSSLIEGDFTGTTTYANLLTWTLSPVTAANGATGTATDYTSLTPKTLRSLDLSVTTARTLSATTTYNSATGQYIDIKFWVMSQLNPQDIVLQDLVITASNTISTQDAIIEAIRVATWTELYWDGDSWESTTLDTVNTFAYDDGVANGVGNDYGFVFTAGMRGYSATAALNSVVTPATLVGLHSEYYNSAIASDLASVYVGTTTTISGADVVATLPADHPSLLNVRIYIEGWDAQTTNSVLAADFSVAFKLSIQP